MLTVLMADELGEATPQMPIPQLTRYEHASMIPPHNKMLRELYNRIFLKLIILLYRPHNNKCTRCLQRVHTVSF